MDVDAFLKDFIPLRKLCNERRFKCEKLAEQLSSAHIRASSFSNTPYSSYVPNVMTNSDVSASTSQLYPSLLSLSSTSDHLPPTYGFKM